MNNKKDLIVSIIIPTYNTGELLKETLDSISKQTFKNWECNIIDDGSSDNTVNIINSQTSIDNRFKFYERPPSYVRGANSCRNYGFQKSKGKYIQWFDSDDLMHPEMLEEKIKCLENSTADFVVAEGFIIKLNISNTVGKWNSLKSSSPLLDHALGVINFQTNAAMFRRNFIDNKVLWDPDLNRKQDYDFFSTMLTFKPFYKVIEKPLFYYRVHQNTINTSNENSTLKSMIQADLNVFKNVINSDITSDEKLKLKRHFLHKTLLKLKKAKRFKNINAIKLCFKNIYIFIDYNYLKVFLRKKILS